MSKDFIISLGSHIVFILLLVIFVPVTAYYQIKGYPQVYRVGLISLPAGGMGGGGGEEVKATLGEAKKAEGIGLKEIKTEQKKKRESKISQQKIELTKKSTPVSAKKGEGKATSAKEGAGEGYEISLGGGLGSAFVEGGDFESPYYLNIAFGRIRENFTNPLRQTNLPIRATVYFIIQKNGKIVESKIETSSGITIFDQSALRAVLSSDPLPPLPQGYKGEWLGIHLEFEFLP
ncbi:MAG: cell envelope integrity protein TolA [candidate division Zixibacteria bacterium]|nr:cell envelope integrity protein TolA [candidate division Zixibacteria bacterium]